PRPPIWPTTAAGRARRATTCCKRAILGRSSRSRKVWRVAKLGKPPAADLLRALDPPWASVRAAEDKLARIYYASGPNRVAWNEFRAWGPAHNARFDHHQPDAGGEPHVQSRKILYCAKQGMTCFAEVFQGTRVVNRADNDP